MRGDRVALHSMKELKRGLEKLERINMDTIVRENIKQAIDLFEKHGVLKIIGYSLFLDVLDALGERGYEWVYKGPVNRFATLGLSEIDLSGGGVYLVHHGNGSKQLAYGKVRYVDNYTINKYIVGGMYPSLIGKVPGTFKY